MKTSRSRCLQILQTFVITALFLLPATRVLAVPISYTFSTGPIIGATNLSGFNQPLLDALSGLSVTGSFAYDSEVPLSSTSDGPFVFGQANYQGAISNIAGSVGPLPFAGTGANGIASVADEGYAPPVPGFIPRDFLQVSENASGIVLDGLALQLVNVRLFWIEGLDFGQGPLADFLSDSSLAGQLPAFQGRLALDFLSIAAAPGDFSSSAFAFFDGLKVTPVAVAEPSSLSLFVLAGALLLFAAMRTRRRSLL